MAGGVLGAAGFLQPCQGEQQALSGKGRRLGRRTRGLPSALLPAPAQKDRQSQRREREIRAIRGHRGAGESSPTRGSGLRCFPGRRRRRKPQSRRGSGRTWDSAGVSRRGRGRDLNGRKDSYPELLGPLACQALG